MVLEFMCEWVFSSLFREVIRSVVTIEVPKQVFLGLVEGFLNEEGYTLYLVVEELVVKKTFSCKQEGCGKPFDAYSPDDEHTVPHLEEKPDAIWRSPKCPNGHINVVWWGKEAGPKFTFLKT